jgi:hypothetical protein
MSNSASASSNTASPSGIVLQSTSFAFWGAVGSILMAIVLVGLVYLYTWSTMPMPLSIALLVLAVIEGSTGYFSLLGKRVAWAFSLSINGTCSVVLLFAAPRIRDAASVSLIAALVPCLAFGLLVLLQSLSPEEF